MNTSEFKRFVVIREAIKGQLTRFATWLTRYNSTKYNELESRLEANRDCLNKFYEVQLKIVLLDDQSDHETEYENFEQQFHTLMALAESIKCGDLETVNISLETLEPFVNKKSTPSKSTYLPIELSQNNQKCEVDKDDNISEVSPIMHTAINKQNVISCNIQRTSRDIISSTASISIKDSKNKINKDKFIKCGSLLDSGSQMNFITKQLVDQLGLNVRKVQMPISGINQLHSIVDYCVDATMESSGSNCMVNLSFLIFRKQNIVSSAHIAGIYRQVDVGPEHRDLQRIIVWRASPEEELEHYRGFSIFFGHKMFLLLFQVPARFRTLAIMLAIFILFTAARKSCLQDV